MYKMKSIRKDLDPNSYAVVRFGKDIISGINGRILFRSRSFRDFQRRLQCARKIGDITLSQQALVHYQMDEFRGDVRSNRSCSPEFLEVLEELSC